MGIPGTIVCVDCGGTCHRWPPGPPELGWRAGDVVTYRCPDCADVWYVELDADDVEADDGQSSNSSLRNEDRFFFR